MLRLDEPTEKVWIGVIEEITKCLIELAREIAVIIIEQHPWSRMHVANHAYMSSISAASRCAAGCGR
ncbi:ABC-type branched-subunit amino acid transport system ATPase component [Bradyrhizobium sp. LB14.3]